MRANAKDKKFAPHTRDGWNCFATFSLSIVDGACSSSSGGEGGKKWQGSDWRILLLTRPGYYDI